MGQHLLERRGYKSVEKKELLWTKRTYPGLDRLFDSGGEMNDT